MAESGLMAWLAACADEDEAAAKRLDRWPLKGNLFIGYEDEGGTWREADYDPQRALREVAFKRKLLAAYQAELTASTDEKRWRPDYEAYLLGTVRMLAAVYSDRPGYGQFADVIAEARA